MLGKELLSNFTDLRLSVVNKKTFYCTETPRPDVPNQTILRLYLKVSLCIFLQMNSTNFILLYMMVSRVFEVKSAKCDTMVHLFIKHDNIMKF